MKVVYEGETNLPKCQNPLSTGAFISPRWESASIWHGGSADYLGRFLFSKNTVHKSVLDLKSLIRKYIDLKNANAIFNKNKTMRC